MAEQGLRERKKQRTRQLIATTAHALFVERGFDAVTVAEVARRADVSVATVFNYFPTKEDLVYSQMEAFQTALVEAIGNRGPGVPVSAAFRGFVFEYPQGLLADHDPDALEDLVAGARMIAGSPALRARERQTFDECIASLAEVLAAEVDGPDDDVEAWVVANALVGVQRALVTSVRRMLLAGTPGPELARAVRTQGERALATLESGLGTRPSTT
ncbi:MAG: TetR family transcriptional regulator [Streptosporangiales bacterium]|nr:TetR family transcriptional regulator [Streptosporangiales bacterium]